MVRLAHIEQALSRACDPRPGDRRAARGVEDSQSFPEARNDGAVHGSVEELARGLTSEQDAATLPVVHAVRAQGEERPTYSHGWDCAWGRSCAIACACACTCLLRCGDSSEVVHGRVHTIRGPRACTSTGAGAGPWVLTWVLWVLTWAPCHVLATWWAGGAGKRGLEQMWQGCAEGSVRVPFLPCSGHGPSANRWRVRRVLGSGLCACICV